MEEMAVACVRCNKLFNFLDELRSKSDNDKAVGDILFEKYGSTEILCENCR